MTAFDRYQRLEGPGLWAASAQDQRRDVVVRFGEATLIIADARSEQVLSHWSLAATQRQNPGKTPAVFVPTGEAADGPQERLELDDPLLIDALDMLHRALSPRRGWWARGRRVVFIAVTGTAAFLLALFWLPGALVNHTASVVPLAKRVQIAQAILADLTTDPQIMACGAPRGSAALQSLGGRVFAVPRRIVVLRGLPPDAPGAFHLPGRYIVLSARTVERLTTPEALAGLLLVEAERAVAHDPLRPVLDHVGLQATLRLLTTGDLPDGALRGYARVALQDVPAPLDPAALLARFEGAQIDPSAYAAEAASEALGDALDLGWAATPFDVVPLITDQDWVSLQNICDM